MNYASHKVSQYLLVIVKLFVLCVFGGVIFTKIAYLDETIRSFFINIIENENNSFLWVLLFVFLASFNWFFEILKWKTLVKTCVPITFKTALKQSLASLTVSLATPNRVGEYGAKALYFNPRLRKKVMLLNFYGGFTQMAVTTFFGSIGIYILLQKYGESFLATFFKTPNYIALAILTICFLVGFLIRKKQLFFKGLTLQNVYKKCKNIPVIIKGKVFLFSGIRYLIFSFLFFKILQFYGVSISLFETLPFLFVMYFLSSVIPSVFVLDVLARGGIALWLFSFINVSALPVAATVFTMWVLNFIFPAIIGSYYVIRYKPQNAW